MRQYYISVTKAYSAGDSEATVEFLIPTSFLYLTYLSVSFILKAPLGTDYYCAGGTATIADQGTTLPLADILEDVNVINASLVGNTGNPFCSHTSPFYGRWRIPAGRRLALNITCALIPGTPVPVSVNYNYYAYVNMQVDPDIPDYS